MNTIKLNNNEYEVMSYNKNTSFYEANPTSNAYFIITTSHSGSTIDSLNALAKTTITSVEITYDGDTIYSLQNVSGKIESINESLNSNKIDVNVNMKFEIPAGA